MVLVGLVNKARKGDDNAFYELIRPRQELLYRTAYTYVQNREDALDIVGESVCKAYQSLKGLKNPSSFYTWLTRILINCSLDVLNSKKRTVPLEQVEPIPDQSEMAIENLDLQRAVDELEEKCRTVIILKYFHDLTIREVAEVMECPQGTVKTYLHRALKRLRMEYKEGWLNA